MIFVYDVHHSRREPRLVLGTLLTIPTLAAMHPCCAEGQQCSNGLAGVQNGDVCCDADCGTCGGRGCGGRTGGGVSWCLFPDYYGGWCELVSNVRLSLWLIGLPLWIVSVVDYCAVGGVLSTCASA